MTYTVSSGTLNLTQLNSVIKLLDRDLYKISVTLNVLRRSFEVIQDQNE